jgi:phosphoribosyl 1,2-cyclic phosphodiesterase
VQGFEITFHGVRGSTPCHGDEIARYGGNTSSVSVDVPGHDPILFDLGTGVRYFGLQDEGESPFNGSCLLSHLHWDHVQGLPFFTPLLSDGAHLDIYAPVQPDGRGIQQVLNETISPPLFPLPLADFPGDISFHEVEDSEFMIGEVAVTSRSIPHIGPTCGYRLDYGGASVAYLSDHQQPGVDAHGAAEGALELCDGVDVLIHDAQYTAEEFKMKSTWGHCTVDYAIWLAAECGVGTLALFHHDPLRDDDQVDEFVAMGNKRIGAEVQVVGAREGLTLRIGS